MSNTLSDYQMDKSAFTVAALTYESDERDYWAAKTPEERLAALEFMRQLMYGYDPATLRLQRVLEVAELSSS
ncbi:MAG TPA: hypothetical protein VF707_01340 [Ardenticatenaceae bacterium]